ncbi:MAG: tetratricopeptide repeat protein, partial [Verrucomicrobia bacterium]|nr:tetratricopeptide repeat protein [Verrucomicrobiota bacterium]
RLPIGALAGALTVVLLAVAGAGLFLRQQRSASEPRTLAYATPSHPPTMTPNAVPTPQPSASDDPQQRAALAFLAAAERAEAEKNRAEAIEDYAAACAAAGEAFAREHTPAGKAYADPQQLQKELSRFDAKFNGPAHQPSASLLVQRANLRLALGRWDAAAEDYAQALKLEPDSAEAKRGLALAKAAAVPAATATPSQESGEKSQQAAP